MAPDDLLIAPSAPEPIYRQIMEQLRRLIGSGQLSAGESLPSVRDVSGHHAINPMTVSRAYGLLEMEGLLERQRGRGMVVAASRRRLQTDDHRLTQLEPSLKDIVRKSRELGLPDRRVIERLKELLEKDS